MQTYVRKAYHNSVVANLKVGFPVFQSLRNQQYIYWQTNVEKKDTFISVFHQLDAQNLFHNKFYFMPLHVSSTCARNM